MDNIELYNSKYKGLPFFVSGSSYSKYILSTCRDNYVEILDINGKYCTKYLLFIVIANIKNEVWIIDKTYIRKKKLLKILNK